MEEPAVLRVLFALDPFLFEMGRSTGLTAWIAPVADWRPAFIGLRFISFFISSGNAKQTFRGDAAIRTRFLRLLDARKNPLARHAGFCSICSDIDRCERLDDLGTEISCARRWPGLGTNLSRTSDHRGPSHLVLSRQIGVAASSDLHLSTVAR